MMRIKDLTLLSFFRFLTKNLHFTKKVNINKVVNPNNFRFKKYKLNKMFKTIPQINNVCPRTINRK